MLFIIKAFMRGFRQASVKRYVRAEQKMRATLTEPQLDSMICDSFPASDPPSTY